MGCFLGLYYQLKYFLLYLISPTSTEVTRDVSDTHQHDTQLPTETQPVQTHQMSQSRLQGVTTVRANNILLNSSLELTDVASLRSLAGNRAITLYVIARVQSDAEQDRVRAAFNDADVFSASFPYLHLLFCETPDAEKSMARALDSQLHVTDDAAITKDLCRFVPAIAHKGSVPHGLPHGRNNVHKIHSIADLV